MIKQHTVENRCKMERNNFGGFMDFTNMNLCGMHFNSDPLNNLLGNISMEVQPHLVHFLFYSFIIPVIQI